MATRLTLLPGSLLIAVSLVSANADAGNFTHTPDVKLDVKLTERVKPRPKRDTPAAPAAAPVDLLELAGLLTNVQAEQAQILRDLIAETPDTDVDDKADLYFRLGEIDAKRQRTHRLTAIEQQLAAEREPDAKKKAALAASAADHQAKAKAALLSAIATYQKLTDNPIFRNYAKLDVALFSYAYTLQSAGYAAPARSAFDKLLKDYPRSKYVPEAHFAFAEHDFEVNELADAAARYKKVLEFPHSSVYWYALYKLGWVDLNLGKPQDALEVFFQVAQGTKGDTAHDVLHRAAEHDFVRAYAEIGRADKAEPAFRRVDDKGAMAMLATLGDLYLDQGKADKAIFVFRQLITAQPRAANVCVWEHSVARAMLTLGTMNDRVHEIEQLVRLWVALRDHKTLPAAEASECHDAAAEMSGELARAYHQEAVKTQNAALFGYSERLYRAYLTAFTDAQDVGETQYFLAELGWARAELEHDPRLATERWEDAAKSFTAVVDAGKVDAKLVQVSADAAMLAWMKSLAIDPRSHDNVEAQEPDLATIPIALPIPPREQQLLAAYDGYLTHVHDPKDEERVTVMFQKARLLRRFNRLGDAIPIFRDIVEHHLEHETAEFAANLVLDGYNHLHDDTALVAYAEELMKKTTFLDEHQSLRAVVVKVRLLAVRKGAERLEADAKRTHKLETYVACGAKYLDAYNQAPEADDAPELLYNAGVCYEEGRSIDAARRVYERLQQLYPKHPLAARALVRLGNAYASTAYYREAAQTFEQYATQYAGEKDAYDALGQGGTFRKGLGDDPQAIDDTMKFIRLFRTKHPADAATAMFSLIDVYEKLGDVDQLVRHLHAYIDQFGAIGGSDRLVVAWSKIGQARWQQACPVKAVDGSCMRVVRAPAIDKRLRLRLRGGTVPEKCGDDSKVEITMIPRDERKVKEAMAAFGNAIAEFDRRAGKVGGDARRALYYYALARLGRTEHDYERYLALPIPSGLDFDHRKPAIAAKSLKRFNDWFVHKREVGTALHQQYQAIVALKDGATTIEAAARLGETAQQFSAQLYRAEIPADLRVGPYAEDTAQAYCDELAVRGEPLEQEALASYEGCLVTSTKLGWFSEWSRVCERELGQLQPEKWPSTLEVRRAPDQVSRIGDVEPSLTME